MYRIYLYCLHLPESVYNWDHWGRSLNCRTVYTMPCSSMAGASSAETVGASRTVWLHNKAACQHHRPGHVVCTLCAHAPSQLFLAACQRRQNAGHPAAPLTSNATILGKPDSTYLILLFLFLFLTPPTFLFFLLYTCLSWTLSM